MAIYDSVPVIPVKDNPVTPESEHRYHCECGAEECRSHSNVEWEALRAFIMSDQTLEKVRYGSLCIVNKDCPTHEWDTHNRLVNLEYVAQTEHMLLAYWG